MNPYQPPDAELARRTAPSPTSNSTRTLWAMLVGVVCLVVGGVVLIGSLFALLGLASPEVRPQSAGEAIGVVIMNLVLAAMGGYLMLYGIKRIKGPRPSKG